MLTRMVKPVAEKPMEDVREPLAEPSVQDISRDLKRLKVAGGK